MSSDLTDRSLHTLFKENHRWLTSRLLRHVRDHGEAEDLCSDTFTELLFRKTDLSVIQHPRAFLMRIGQRLVYRRYRERELERACLDTLAQLAPEVAPSAEDVILMIDAIQRLDHALHGLSAPARAAFFHSQVDGLNYDEIAQRLRVSFRTVVRYMKQALQCCEKNGLF